MKNNKYLELYNKFLEYFDVNEVYSTINKIDNVLIISNNTNTKIANFWSNILNQKFGCIVTSLPFSLVNEKRIRVYNNILILDEESEKYIKSVNYHGNVIFMNQTLQNIIKHFEKSNKAYILSNIMMGLTIYYSEKTFDKFNNIIDKLKSFEISNIENYDVVVCNSLIACGIDLFNHKFEVITALKYIDDYNSKDKVLYINALPYDDSEAINSMNKHNNLSIINCSFDNNVDQIVYGALFCLLN